MTTPFGPWVIGFRGQVLPLVVFADIISDNWDGAIPPNLPDDTATQGYALDASDGAAQFNGLLQVNGNLRVGANGDLIVGDADSTDAQMFIDNTLQHFNMRANDDPDYPDQVGIIDVVWDAVEGRIMRLFWAEPDGGGGFTFLRLLEMFPNSPLVNFLPGLTASGDAALSISDIGLARENQPAYMTLGTLVYTANDTFTKADWPALRGIRVRAQAPGGGSGGCATTAAGQVSGGGNGGGGEYVENLFIPVSDLAATEAITVPQGGAGGAAGNNNGTAGADTVFDTISGEVRANGGGGGGGGAATAPLTGVIGSSGAGGTGGTGGHFTISGSDAIQGFTLASNRLYPGAGGGSYMSGLQSRSIAGASIPGTGGLNFGGGAMGPMNAPSIGQQAGQAGGDGLLLIDLYV